MNLNLDKGWYQRQEAHTNLLRAEQDAIPDPAQADYQDFDTARGLYERHCELYPKGTWLLARKAWKSMMFAHRRGDVYCRYFVTGQIAGSLPYTPDPITDAEKVETDWVVERNLAWLDW